MALPAALWMVEVCYLLMAQTN